MGFDYDLFVIGGGSGGLAASKRAAAHGAKVALAEEDLIGGTCVIRGCIPKKLMVYASHFSDYYEDAVGYGWEGVTGQFHWSRLIAAKDKEIQRLNDLHTHWLTGAGVTLLSQRATLLDNHTVQVGETQVTAAKVLIAVGGIPVRPLAIPGMEYTLTSNEMFHLPVQPRRLAVLGAGYIAVEFAGIMHGLGTEVTQIIRGDNLLRGFDDDLRAMVRDGMEQHGINLRFTTLIEKIEKKDDGLVITLSQGDPIEVDAVLCAIGRVPHVEGLGLENAGVETVLGAVKVDEYSRTTQANIFAVGDCTNRINLTPMAVAEGRAFADTEFGNHPRTISQELVPTAVFSQPELGTVGLTETEAMIKYGPEAVRCFRAKFRPLYHTLSGRAEKTLVKLVVHSPSDKVLGAHMAGPSAAEVIQGIAIALNMGATKKDFDTTIGIHPSVAEEFVTLR
ncbi:glutathione-disulfide reductase [Candidatus Cyanaurora vandensis]|uniref:glutathione-disulfide reductase n=1 Tax=Candidatus Cyanaurora vandensis TaxID=2714958 RepID=UPI00257F08D3|nr:glutathione-disulfide reductase [Candidatus Cyanaurora vandensis]